MSMSEQAGRPNIIARAVNILVRTGPEWTRIEREPDTVGGLFGRYFVWLAAIPAVAVLIRSLWVGYSVMGVTVRPDVVSSVIFALYAFGLGLLGAFLFGLIIEFLSPNFAGEKNRVQAMKVAVYGSTAGALAGLFLVAPKLEFLLLLGLYDFWLLWRGLPELMKVNKSSALPYLIISSLALGVIMLVILLMTLPIVSAITGMAKPQGMQPSVSGRVDVPGVGSVDIGELQKGLEGLEEARGGAALPMGAMKTALPETLPGGWTRTETSSARGEAAGFTGSTEEATYTKGEGRIDLTLGESSALGALQGLAGIIGAQQEEDDGQSYSKMGEIDGRLTLEEFDRTRRKGKYAVMVGERFMVQAEGEGVDMADLKAAVGAVDQGKLQALAK